MSAIGSHFQILSYSISLQTLSLLVSQVHDAIWDSVLETAVLADHMVKMEPCGMYGNTNHRGVDGLIDVHGP